MNIRSKWLGMGICVLLVAVSLGSPTPLRAAETNGGGAEKVKKSQLTEEERKILEQGPYSDGSFIGGGLAGTLLGFGIGHAIQGRYIWKGILFTVGEIATAALFVSAAGNCLTESLFTSPGYSCSQSSTMTLASLGLLGLRIWEIIDVWAVPASHNNEYRRIKYKTGENPYGRLYLSPVIHKVASASSESSPASFGIMGGVQWRF